MPTPEYHASLSPSSAERWINCPASVRLSADVPKTTSADAEAGRLAHKIAELKAQKKFTPKSARTYNSRLKKLQAAPEYRKEMDGYTDTYVEVLTEQAMSFDTSPTTALEASVPIGEITGERKADGAPATGTADCIQVGGGMLWVTDYKNGAGVPVSAIENPQMKLYALGALQLFSAFYGHTIQTVKMTIVQPALDSISSWETARADLEAWARNVVGPAAEQARQDICEPHPGEWCRTHFCPIRDTCRARAYDYLALEAFGQALPPTLTDTEVGDILIRAEGLVSWANALRGYALDACLKGREIPGWKAVEGRSNYAFKDPDLAINTLIENGYPREVIFDQKPKTLAQLKKMLGKKEFDRLLGDQEIKPPGKPTLAHEADKRLPYNPAAVAFGSAGSEK